MREPAASVGRLADVEPLHGTRRLVVLMGAALAIAAVRVIDDSVTGVSLGVFYILPVAIAAILCDGIAASVLAVVAATTWSLGDATASPGVVITNSVFRSMILLFIVFVLRALFDTARRARASERRSQEFLAFIAHQLRTPTATASATAQSLLAEGADPEHEEAYLRISSETQRIGRLVSTTLRYVRLDQDPHPRTATDLVSVCRVEVERHQVLPGAPLCLHAPASVLESKVSAEGVSEALSCLIENARRHAASRVDVDVRAHGHTAVLTVRDDGPGMPDEVARRAFEPFVALDGRGGTGLGLAIAERLVVASGGAIDYGREGFTLRFPLLTN
jgi:signal transduction histidine kinase